MQQPEAVNATLSPYKFLEYITHELANPLNGMLMSVELMGRFAAANPRAANEIGDLLKILNNETNRLALLLKELHGSGVLLDVDRQPTSLAAEISDLLALESAYYEQRQVRIHQEFPADLPPILADRSKLRQVLLNLCKNAVEAMPNGGTLTIRCCASEAWLCLEIADTGIGIPAGMPVFEPAVTDKPQGSGLGLAIVRELVQQHEGTVSYTTQLGKGTTFHLKFPIPAVNPSNPQEKPPGLPRGLPPAKARQRRGRGNRSGNLLNDSDYLNCELSHSCAFTPQDWQV